MQPNLKPKPTCADTSEFDELTDLASSKSKLDK